MLGFTHLFPHNELAHLPYIAGATNTRAEEVKSSFLSYLPNPSARVGYDTRSIFKRSLTDLNSEFSFS